MKTNLKLYIAAAFAAPLASAQTAPFQWELNADYTTRETDIEDVNVNEDNIGFDATFYFEAIGDRRGPLRERPFLSRASSLGFGVNVDQLDDDLDNLIDVDSYRINGLFVAPESGWYSKLGYMDSNADFDGVPISGLFRYSPEYDGYTVEFGKYVAQNTTLGLAYSAIDYDNFTSNSSIESGADTIGLTFRHFGSFSDTSGYSIEANYYVVDLQVADFDDLDDDPFDNSGEVYSFKATYYPTEAVGVGLAYADSDDLGGRPYIASSNAIQDGASIFAEWFATDRLSLKTAYTNSEYDLSNFDNLDDPGEVDSDSLSFSAGYRF